MVMKPEDEVARRRLVAAGVGILLGAPVGAEALQGAGKINPDQGVTAPEDLMKEHGVLNRCLLIYEEGVRRLRGRQEIPPEVFQHTASLIRRFVEEYHEKNEERYIFPQFKRAGKLTDLVSVLLQQHKSGRVVTAEILRLSTPDTFGDPANRERLVTSIESFLRMYRPHEAREEALDRGHEALPVRGITEGVR